MCNNWGNRHDDLLKTPSVAQHNHSNARLASGADGATLRDTHSVQLRRKWQNAVSQLGLIRNATFTMF